IKEVIAVELMMIIDLVIDPQGGLIATLPRSGNALELIRTAIGERDKLVEQVNRGRIEALCRDLISRKDVRVSSACRDCCSAGLAHGGRTTWPLIEDAGKIIVSKGSGKGGSLGKISISLRCSRDCHNIGRDALYDAPAFIRAKEKGTILPNRSTQSATKLVLLKVRCLGVEEAAGIEGLVAKELEHVAMEVIASTFGDHIHYRT